jgi:hypothetical protein
MTEAAFIVIGHGRSGTQYMAELLNVFGYDVKHENPGRNGVSAMDALSIESGSRLFVSYDKERNRLLYKAAPSTKTIHVVRNPWDVLESDYGHSSGVAVGASKWYWEILEKTGIDKVLTSIVVVNKKIAEYTIDLTVKVEEAETVVADWLKIERRSTGLRKDIGHKDHKSLTAAGYASASPGTLEAFKEHCTTYGYPTEPS